MTTCNSIFNQKKKKITFTSSLFSQPHVNAQVKEAKEDAETSLYIHPCHENENVSHFPISSRYLPDFKLQC